MKPKPQVVVTEFRGHPVFSIEVGGSARFRFGKTKATCLVDNWSKVKGSAETGDGNEKYKGYDALQLDLGKGRFFRFGRYKATLCVKVKDELHEFAGASREELRQEVSVSPASSRQTDGDSPLPNGDGTEDCLRLAVHVAFADEQILNVEIREIKDQLHGAPKVSELVSDLLGRVQADQSSRKQCGGVGWWSDPGILSHAVRAIFSADFTSAPN